jgi:hypothetical protein
VLQARALWANSMSSAILVSEVSYLQVYNAAAQLSYTDRDPFVAAVRDALGDQLPGEGAIARAVSVAFATYWQPPPDSIAKPSKPPSLRRSIR